MNSDLPILVMTPVDPHQYPDRVQPPDTSRKPLPKTTAEMVLGYEPSNRHDRRKAARLLRSRAR
jgi:hypothetical protein